jgi:hypothetical protein
MRAKVAIRNVERPYAGCETITFNPVTGNEQFGPNGESENNTYARYTPSGEIKLSITNPSLHNLFQPGQEFYVDFTPASAPTN